MQPNKRVIRQTPSTHIDIMNQEEKVSCNSTEIYITPLVLVLCNKITLSFRSKNQWISWNIQNSIKENQITQEQPCGYITSWKWGIFFVLKNEENKTKQKVSRKRLSSPYLSSLADLVKVVKSLRVSKRSLLRDVFSWRTSVFFSHSIPFVTTESW